MKLKNLFSHRIKKKIKSILRSIDNINKPKYLKFNNYWIQRIEIKSVSKRKEFFKKICTNKKVLHFGCTDWPIFDPNRNLHIELSKYAESLHGFDIDLEGIENLKHYVDQDYFSDYTEIQNNYYDVCLIPETIEHVDNVKLFLENISLIKADIFIITAPNCFSKEHISRNFYGKNQFIEVVHPDHNCWYSPFTLKNQIEKYSKLKVRETILLEKDTMVCCIASHKE